MWVVVDLLVVVVRIAAEVVLGSAVGCGSRRTVVVVAAVVVLAIGSRGVREEGGIGSLGGHLDVHLVGG